MFTRATPEFLWHYTDANGLHGIVSSSRLRFGDANFLNDRTERTYGVSLLDAVFDEVVRADATGTASTFQQLARAMRLRDRLYVCCLSGNEESISQWQRYGADGNGYCIGFSTRELDLVLDEDRVSRHEMVYDESTQRELLRAAILSGLEQYRELKTTESESRRNYYDYLFTDVDIHAAELQMKNPFFHDEQEWRYFVTSDDEDDDFEHASADDASDTTEEADGYLEPTEMFAPRGHYVKPFLELPLIRKDVVKRLPITTVICGPRLDRDVVVATVRRFLRSRGYATSVEHSRLADIWR